MSDFLSEFVPRLDTIEFDELADQARGDIPRYAPDWTDHNLHDPGMTMIDLLAWIVDQQVYRTGFVGGRHRAAFAALLGVRPQGPATAQGLVWPDRTLDDGRFLAAGSPVVCDAHRGLPFALQDDVYLPPAALTAVQLVIGGVEMPAPSPKADGGSWTVGASGQMAETVLTLTFDRSLTFYPAPGSTVEEAHVPLAFDIVPPPGTPIAATDVPHGPVVYSYRENGSAWDRLRVVRDGTMGLAATGVVILALPPSPAPGPAGAAGSQLRLTFDRGFFPVPPQIRAASINVLPIVQRADLPAAVFDEPVSGQPDHVVQIDSAGLVPPPSRPGGPVLEIEVDEERWQEQPDFSRSGPADPHYVVRPGRIVFGNGLNGRRPERGASIRHTGLARTEGAPGNLRRKLVWSVPALEAAGIAYGRNTQPLTGGTDSTGPQGYASSARDAATRRAALLTDEELAAAAFALPGMAVARADVVAGFDHRLPGRRVDAVRTLVVLPSQISGPDSAGTPGTPPAYLAEVARRLRPRRVLGERLIVQAPVVVAVELWLTVTVEPGAAAADVEDAIRQALNDRLSAVARPDTDTAPWPLGRDLTAAEVQALTASVPGVAEVVTVQVAQAGEPPGDGPVQVPLDGLAIAAGIHITAQGRPFTTQGWSR
jgi:hypothetical protein